jgi:hypothetical protein
MVIKIIVVIVWIAFLIAAYKYAKFRGKMYDEVMAEIEAYIDSYFTKTKEKKMENTNKINAVKLWQEALDIITNEQERIAVSKLIGQIVDAVPPCAAEESQKREE